MVVKNIYNKINCIDKIRELHNISFPPNERYSLDKMFSLMSKDSGIKYQAFIEDDNLCGTIFYAIGKIHVYLFYIAVNDSIRSKGYDSKFLVWLNEQYPTKSIVLNVESIDENAINNQQRVRRLLFYKKNRFVDVGYMLSDDSGKYDILSLDGKFDMEDYKDIIFRLGFGIYNPVVSKKVI